MVPSSSTVPSSVRKYGVVESGEEGYAVFENVTEAAELVGWWCADRVEGKRPNWAEVGEGATTVGIGV